jgi:hypothetical protein
MFAALLLVSHIRVAGLAALVAGKLYRTRGYFADRRPAIVSILAKALGHNEVAHHQKHQKSEDKQPRKPEKMPCILEDAHPTLSITPLPVTSASLFRCDLEHTLHFELIEVPLTAVCEEDHKRL